MKPVYCLTSMFDCPNLFEHFLTHAGQTVWEMRLDASVVKTTHRPASFFHQLHFLYHKQTSYTKYVSLVLQNTAHHNFPPTLQTILMLVSLMK